jgi:hypothetical protein
MILLDRLEDARRQGLVTEVQARALAAAEGGEPFSFHGEIRTLFYIGALLVAAGAGATVKTYFTSWGPAAIIGGLSAGALACFAYVFRKRNPWSRELVPSPSLAFDYALLLGCLLLSLDVGYVEARWHVLGGQWPRHLLVSSLLFLLLAYRFDNRLVLSLGLSSLAAWMGLELGRLGLLFRDVHREYALAFGVFCTAVGVLGRRERLKAHFLDVYLNFACHFLGAALLSGTARYRLGSFHFYVLAALCAGAAWYAFRSRRFLYLTYAVLYGYAAVTTVIFARNWFWSGGFYFLYFIASSVALVAFLFWSSRAMKEEA